MISEYATFRCPKVAEFAELSPHPILHLRHPHRRICTSSNEYDDWGLWVYVSKFCARGIRGIICDILSLWFWKEERLLVWSCFEIPFQDSHFQFRTGWLGFESCTLCMRDRSHDPQMSAQEAIEGVFLTDSVLTEARPDTSVSDQTFLEQWQFHPTCEWSGSRAWGWLFAEGGFQGTITWSGCWISSLVIDMSPSSQVALGNYALLV
jgi:hypothetical protein